MKKLSLILFALIIGLAMSTSLMAGTYSGGDGLSSVTAYQILDKDDILELCTTSGDWGKYFKQTADINFVDADFQSGGAFYNGGAGFSPIGNSTTKFTGLYDGQNHIISGLYINRSGNSASYVGLFGWVANTTIKNLGVTNVNITALKENGNGGSYIGALAGGTDGSSALITNCFSSGTVVGYSVVGGLVGQNWSETYANVISNSYSSVNVTGQNTIGGFVGINHAIVSNCYSRGDVTRSSESSSTSFAAFNSHLYGGTVQKCYTTGNVYYTDATDPTDKGFISDFNDSYSYSNNFWDSDASNQISASGATAKTTTLMKTQSTFTDAGWDFISTWAISVSLNDGYPYLQWALGVDQSLPVELTAFTAIASDERVTLHWVTESEIENLGFNIYRSTKYNDQLFSRDPFGAIINDQLIPGAGNSSSRHEYEYVDKNLTNGVSYWYKLEDVDYSGNTKLHGPVSATPIEKAFPAEFRLYPNYPNPFNPVTTISYDLPEEGYVELTVYNMRGEKVATLMKGNQEAGSYRLNWDGTGQSGDMVASGIYFLRIVWGSYSTTNKMIFIR